ncbi:hypothetical protein NQ315_016517 [Exocentrus adspersus]|uniref:Transposase n=1 Tax=Exocentrus adspersus TaxID=1586481 RepID=A0AAV8VZF7_9CUCU|nr:hypothetical protein NQ315_016517 [Exocentrus adspersus]
MVNRYLEKSGKTIPTFPNQTPERDWCLNFIEGHKGNLSHRSCKNIKGVRAQKTDEGIIAYFENLEKSLEGIPPERVLNYDETNLSADPGNRKCIFRSGTKYPERVINSSETAVSVMFAITGNGETLPPYVIYKAERMYEQWTIGAPKSKRNGFKQRHFSKFTKGISRIIKNA